MAQPTSIQIGWSGQVASCDAGTIDVSTRQQTLALVNYYRSLASLGAVSDKADLNSQAQSCAMMLDANFSLNHFPPTSWQCYSAQGAAGAAASNIAGVDTLRAIELYMLDQGNADTLAHRRWILSNWIGPAIGIGSTENYSCLKVVPATMPSSASGPLWTAWPPPGTVPLQAADVDSTGWSLQSDSIDLSKAIVSVTDNGTSLPVQQSTLTPNYGSKYALAFLPVGWQSRAGHTYAVKVTGASRAIDYSVSFVACP